MSRRGKVNAVVASRSGEEAPRKGMSESLLKKDKRLESNVMKVHLLEFQLHLWDGTQNRQTAKNLLSPGIFLS